MPERGGGSGIIRREQQREHEDDAAGAGGAHQNAGDEAEADGELTISDEKGDWRSVRQNKAAKNRRHERIRAAFEKSIDPILKAAVESELRAEDFVFAEDQEKKADADAQEGESLGVAVGR